MPADIGLDSRITAVRTSISSGLSFADAVINLTNQLESTINAFGTAALVNTGTSQGDIPLLEAGGRLNRNRIPEANEASRGGIQIATPSEVQAGTDNEKAITSAGLNQRIATRLRAGIGRLATPAQARLGTSQDLLMAPATTIAVGDDRYLRADRSLELLNIIWVGDLQLDNRQGNSTTQTLLRNLRFPAADQISPSGNNEGEWRLACNYEVNGVQFTSSQTGGVRRPNNNVIEFQVANPIDGEGTRFEIQIRVINDRQFQFTSNTNTSGNIRLSMLRVWDD